METIDCKNDQNHKTPAFFKNPHIDCPSSLPKARVPFEATEKGSRMMDTNKGNLKQKKHDRGYSCPHYYAPPGEKRCRNYLKGGCCARPDELMCVEWLKKNGDSKSTPKKRQFTDLFGNPLPEPKKARRTVPMQHLPMAVPEATPEAAEDNPSAIRVDQLPGLKDEDIASFKALGVEVCLESEAFGKVWLVPALTGRDRKEITAELVAAICRTAAVFPGSQIVSFGKSKQQNCHDCKCRQYSEDAQRPCPNPCQKCKQRRTAPSQRRAG